MSDEQALRAALESTRARLEVIEAEVARSRARAVELEKVHARNERELKALGAQLATAAEERAQLQLELTEARRGEEALRERAWRRALGARIAERSAREHARPDSNDGQALLSLLLLAGSLGLLWARGAEHACEALILFVFGLMGTLPWMERLFRL